MGSYLVQALRWRKSCTAPEEASKGWLANKDVQSRHGNAMMHMMTMMHV